MEINMRPIPEYPGMADPKKYMEWLEQLKQRLRDAGQHVPENPLNLPEPTEVPWPRYQPYTIPPIASDPWIC